VTCKLFNSFPRHLSESAKTLSASLPAPINRTYCLSFSSTKTINIAENLRFWTWNQRNSKKSFPPLYLNCLNEMAVSIDHGSGKLEIADHNNRWIVDVLTRPIGRRSRRGKRRSRWSAVWIWKQSVDELPGAEVCPLVHWQRRLLHPSQVTVERCSKMYQRIGAITFLQGDSVLDQKRIVSQGLL